MLCVFLLGAAVTDVKCGKVRNRWVLLGIAAGIGCVGWRFLLPAVVVLIPAFLLFRLRMMGAGDGKVMAVIAGYLGFSDGCRAIAAGLLTGALWSLYRLWRSGGFRARLWYLAAYFVRMFQERKVYVYDALSGGAGGHRIPLAACLAAGTGLYLAVSWTVSGGKII